MLNEATVSGFAYTEIRPDGSHGPLKFASPERDSSIATIWNPRDKYEQGKIARATDWILNAAANSREALDRALLATHPGSRIEQLDSSQTGFWRRLFHGQSLGHALDYQAYYGEKLATPYLFGTEQGIRVSLTPPDQKPSNIYTNDATGFSRIPYQTATGELENFHFHNITPDAIGAHILGFGTRWTDYDNTHHAGVMGFEGAGDQGPRGPGAGSSRNGQGGGGSHGTRGEDAATTYASTAGTNRFLREGFAGAVIPADQCLAAITSGRYRAETLAMGGYGGSQDTHGPGPGQVVIAAGNYTESREAADRATWSTPGTPADRELRRRNSLNVDAYDGRSGISENQGCSSGGLYLAICGGEFTWAGSMSARGAFNSGNGGSGALGRMTVFCFDGANSMPTDTVANAVVSVYQFYAGIPADVPISDLG